MYNIYFSFFQHIVSSSSASQVTVSTATIFLSPDFAVRNFLNINIIDSNTKYTLLSKHWITPNNYLFPYSIQMEKKKKICNLQLFKYVPLACYVRCKGLYCKYCLLFASATKSNATLKTLVKTPLLKFS